METKQQRIEVGPVADKFLRAVRAYETAKQFYYDGLEALMGEERANARMMEENDGIFKPVGEHFDRMVYDLITDWSISNPPTNTI